MKMREALLWSAFWLLLALLFAAALAHWRGQEESFQFLAGYLVEFSLSLDNVSGHRASFLPPSAWRRSTSNASSRWGIVGALLMRGLMIGAGAALLQSFHWLLYVMGAVFRRDRPALGFRQTGGAAAAG